MNGTGLILEGGGMRGAYTAGVLDCLLDNGLHFRTVYGVSAGACHACSYLSRQRGRAIRTVTDYLGDKRYAGVYSLLTTGDFFGVSMIYDEIPNHLIPYDYEAFAREGAAFTVVATNLHTGRAEYLSAKDLRGDMAFIRASSSLPLLSRPVEIGGERYLDGGISDSIPLARSIADGNAKHLVVLTRHRGYRKEPDSALRFLRRKYRAYPGLVDSMAHRHERYNQALDLCYTEQEAGRAVIIQPRKPVKLGRLEKNPGKLRDLYRTGYEDAEISLHSIRALVKKAPRHKTGFFPLSPDGVAVRG